MKTTISRKELKKAIKGKRCYVTVGGTETWLKVSKSEILYLYHCVARGAEVMVDTDRDGEAYVSVEGL